VRPASTIASCAGQLRVAFVAAAASSSQSSETRKLQVLKTPWR
jgi:hypothetical protein